MNSASESKKESNFKNNNSVKILEGAEGKKALELPSCTTKTKTPWNVKCNQLLTPLRIKL